MRLVLRITKLVIVVVLLAGCTVEESSPPTAPTRTGRTCATSYLDCWPAFDKATHRDGNIVLNEPIKIDWDSLAREQLGPIDVGELSSEHLEKLVGPHFPRSNVSWLHFVALPPPELLQRHIYLLTKAGIQKLSNLDGLRLLGRVSYGMNQEGDNPITLGGVWGEIALPVPEEIGNDTVRFIVVTEEPWVYSETPLLDHDDGSSPMLIAGIKDGRSYLHLRDEINANVILRDAPVSEYVEATEGVQDGVSAYIITVPESPFPRVYVAYDRNNRDGACVFHMHVLYTYLRKKESVGGRSIDDNSFGCEAYYGDV